MDDELFETKNENSPQVFLRYSREARLKNASDKVKQMHDSGFVQKKSFIKSLTANKGLSSVFFVIVLLVILNLIFFFVWADKNSGKIYGVKTELQAFLYQDKVLANVRLSKTENFTAEREGQIVRVQFVFFDKDKNKISSFLSEGLYTGAELRFSGADDSGKAKEVYADILLKDKILTLRHRVNSGS